MMEGAFLGFPLKVGGIVSKENRFIDTDVIIKMTDENMIYIGKAVFEAANKCSMKTKN